MPLTSIVTIVLRLFSLSWLVQGITMFASAAAAMTPHSSAHPNYWNYAAALLLCLAALGLFVLSHPIARIVTPPPNPEISLGGLSQYDLYCFAFTFLGLYFVLSSIADSLNWLHYFFVVARTTHENDPQRETAFYRLARPLTTLVAGGATLLFAPRCARKLTAIQRNHEAA